jgi:hypothetical protein
LWRAAQEQRSRDYGKLNDELILDYWERVLIRKVLVHMAYESSRSKEDAEKLQRPEYKSGDASQIILKGVR